MSTKKESVTAAVNPFAFSPRTVTLDLEGLSTLEWTKKIPKCPSNVDQMAHEEKHWRDRFHADEEGSLAIPSESVVKALESACSGVKIPGKGSATYSKVVRQGVRAVSRRVHLTLDGKALTREDLVPMPVFVPGSPGGSSETRVDKIFPILPKWSAAVEILVLDPILTEDLFAALVNRAGMFIGIGSWRPENGGSMGMFKATKIAWS